MVEVRVMRVDAIFVQVGAGVDQTVTVLAMQEQAL
jgi:hypothetical protein